MNQTEIFELCKNTEKLQCQDCKYFKEVGIIYCRCGRHPKYNRSPYPNLDCNSINGHLIRKNCSRGPKHGPKERQEQFFKAKDMLRKAKKRSFPTFLARWQEQESFRSLLKDHDICEQEVIIYGRLALERRDYTTTKAERMRYSQNWVLTLNAEGKQPPRQLRPDYEEAKRECQRLQDEFMAANGQLLSTQASKDVKIRINNFKDLRNMTTLLIERQVGGGIRSSKETCRILRLHRLHHGKIPLGNGSHGGGIPRNTMSE